jgi:uncharacterized protein YkwD
VQRIRLAIVTALAALVCAAAAAPQATASKRAASHRAARAGTRARCARPHGHTRSSGRRHGCVAGARPHGSHAGGASKGAPPSASSAGTPTPAEVIAAELATPCTNTEVLPSAANIAVVREAVMCLINHERAEHGEAPLAANPELEQAADEHASELVADDYFAHVSPSGLTPVERIKATGYIPGPSFGYVIGENLAWGTIGLSTPQAIVSAWIASPGHLANILEARYRDTGIGITPAVPPTLGEGEQGATYAQEFGVLLD